MDALDNARKISATITVLDGDVAISVTPRSALVLEQEYEQMMLNGAAGYLYRVCELLGHGDPAKTAELIKAMPKITCDLADGGNVGNIVYT